MQEQENKTETLSAVNNPKYVKKDTLFQERIAFSDSVWHHKPAALHYIWNYKKKLYFSFFEPFLLCLVFLLFRKEKK